MEALAELLGILTLGLLFWVRTGTLSAQVADIATALSTQGGSLTGDAVLERFEAIETRLGKLKADVEEAKIDSDTAKRGVARLSARQTREEEALIGKVTETILPALVQQMGMMQQEKPNGAGQPFLVR